MIRRPPRSTLFPYTTLFRSHELGDAAPVANALENVRGDDGERLGMVELETAPLAAARQLGRGEDRSEEHTSELQSQSNLVCRLLLEKKKAPYSRPASLRWLT